MWVYLSQLTLATWKEGSEMACQPANQAAATMSTVAFEVSLFRREGKDDARATAEELLKEYKACESADYITYVSHLVHFIFANSRTQ